MGQILNNERQQINVSSFLFQGVVFLTTSGKVFHMTKQLPILSGESVTGFLIHHLVYAFFSPLFCFLTFAAWDYTSKERLIK